MQAISNRIIIGDEQNPIVTFENDEIQSINEETAVSLIGDELFIDQLVPAVGYTVYVRYIFKPTNYDGIKTADGYIFCTHYNSDIRRLPYGTKVTYYSNNVIAGVYYIKNVERTGKGLYKLNCVSAVGLMTRQQHKGGIYTGQTFSAVVAEILGTDYTYEIDNDVAAQKVYGWLPYSTRRQNLYQLVMAYGVQIIKSASGNMRFTFLNASGTPATIPKSRLFHGGSVSYQEPASHIEVIEHGYHYMSSVEEEVLLDNPSDYVDHIVVKFDHPVYADSIHASEESTDSLTIHERGTNYAIVSGVGVLLGKAYVHSTKLISLDNPEEVNEKNVSVENATLVTLVNGDNVLERLGQYYFNAMNTKQDIIVDGEKCGGRYQLWNPYNEYMTGFITRMSTRSTSIRRAQCEVIENYTPVGAGAAYTQRAQFDLDVHTTQYWYVPAGVHRVRVVLIGYGDDGEPGEDGEDGEYAEGATPANGGAGGKGGKGGNGAKVYAQTIYTDGLDGLMFFIQNRFAVCNYGNQTISSEIGASSPTGYYDEMSGDLYALPGIDGINGGAGGKGGVWKTRKIDNGEQLVPNESGGGDASEVVFTPVELEWVQGAISSSSGLDTNNTKRIRNAGFYSIPNGETGFGFTVPLGYKVYAFGYTYAFADNGSYVGAISNGFVTGAQRYTNLNGSIHYVRFVVAKTDDSAITPEEATNIHFGFYLPTSSAYGDSYAAVNANGDSGIPASALDDGGDSNQLEWRDAEAGEDVIGADGVIHHGGAGSRNTLPYYDEDRLYPNGGGGEGILVGMIWHHGSFCNPLEMGLSDGGVWCFCGVGGGGGASANSDGYSGRGKHLVALPSSDPRTQWPLPYPGFGTPDAMGDIDTGGNGAHGGQVAPTDSRPGCGGNGGHGGAGGGGAGTSTWYNRTYNEIIFQGMGINSMTAGKGGKGGDGSLGTEGQHGCVIIYY